MTERIEKELEVLRHEYPTLEFIENGLWIKIPKYPTPAGVWNRDESDVAFQIPPGYPGQAPYGIYVPTGIRLKGSGALPQSYNDSATVGGFSGAWGLFSWTPENWFAGADHMAGSNLLNFVRSFRERFSEAS